VLGRKRRPAGWAYGPWDGGADPLAPPFGGTEAMDALSERMLDGMGPAEALRDLMRRGSEGRRGMDELRRMAARRAQQLRREGPVDATLEEVRELLDLALQYERETLGDDPLGHQELDDLPQDTAGAVRALADRQWQSPEAGQAYEQIRDLLHREVLDQQFKGLRDSLAQLGSPEGEAAMSRMKDAMADLASMLEAQGRGEDTSARFEEWMDKYGDLMGDDDIEDIDDLIEALARRRAAAGRLMRSLSADQRAELGALSDLAMQDAGLSLEQARLEAALRGLRPDLFRPGRPDSFDPDGRGQGLGDATTTLEELAQLEELMDALNPDRPGATLDDVDPARVQELLGRDAVDDLRALQDMERALQRENLLQRSRNGEVTLTPRAVRMLAANALKRVFGQVQSRGRGDHDVRSAGSAGEVTGATRPWEFGDTQSIDVVKTLRNAIARVPRDAGARGAGSPIRLAPGDLEVVETERRGGACVCLLIDTSYSMLLRDTWGAAKTTALALHSLQTTQHPQDRMHVIAFSAHAREVNEVELASLEPDEVKGTNLQHALHLAGRRLAAHPDLEPVVLVITDGEPTAHLMRDGSAFFDWPPAPETLELTMAEVEKLTRRGVTINVFMLDDDPSLVGFVEHLAHRNGGRVLSPDPQRLGRYVVDDYLRARKGRRAG
jgi:uncharacterized protein with von Willebrand factor type A (vWA) domain